MSKLAMMLMVQGCTSDAGKSTLVAALGRYYARRGWRVAPFKPQNMALNAAVAEDGRGGWGEIGRAQAFQALACGILPSTDMNPVLLKPTTDVGAQVIIQGHAIGNMNALDYHDYKHRASGAVLESFARLRAQYQAVIVEGAGSPAEINLRANDIANMGFAEAVDCPVILIADIDRGGVFAHLVGTLELLSESEQRRVKGFVINRFRGDLALLQPGLDWLEQRTGKPVLGVLPYLHGLQVDAEDGISREAVDVLAAAPSPQPLSPLGRGASNPSPVTTGEGGPQGRERAVFRVIVPVTPRIANHTDFDALRVHPQIDFRFIGPDEAIPPADLIILPGSKAVRADLDWLRAQGWDVAIARHLRFGGKLMGICGGFQMLGRLIDDPHGLEGAPGQSAALGWLDMATTLKPDKQMRNVTGRLLLQDVPVSGYEIHAGVSEGEALLRPLCELTAADARCVPDGAISADGLIVGSYLHGIFDTPAARDALLAWAGLQSSAAPDLRALREASIERLADTVAEYLDVAALDEILAASVQRQAAGVQA